MVTLRLIEHIFIWSQSTPKRYYTTSCTVEEPYTNLLLFPNTESRSSEYSLWWPVSEVFQSGHWNTHSSQSCVSTEHCSLQAVQMLLSWTSGNLLTCVCWSALPNTWGTPSADSPSCQFPCSILCVLSCRQLVLCSPPTPTATQSLLGSTCTVAWKLL